ncbi:hypothetical protein [Microvirga zambiensis]|uniref:hypothetical protein n=1 Tax=Microvirga zambiensis TaxID=1402137 RepID=UPI001920279A|nr:hypothetical protein [Microvirga zambiensis]
MDDRLAAVVVRLLGVRQALGDASYRDAVGRALQGIAAAAQAEAERRARRHRPVRPGVVVRFPLGRARANQRMARDPEAGR